MASHETDLFKDKIEVKLDERQVFYLFFGGAVIATLVFVLGVMVGRRVEARAVVEGGTTVTDPLAALDRLEGGNDLAFPTALRGDDVSLGSVDANLAKRPKPKLKPAVGGPLVAAPAAKADDAKAAAAKAAAKPAPVVVPKPAKPAKDEAVAAKPAVEDKPAPAADPKADEEKASAKKSRRRFTLQVGSFQDKDEADTFFRTLQGGSYAPYMVEADVPGKGTYFRVRVGGYSSFDEALEAKSTFEDNQHVIAYVTRLK